MQTFGASSMAPHVRFRPAYLALLGVLMLGTLTGCVGFPVPDDVATYTPVSEAGADALLEGVLVRDGGCTYVEDPETGIRTLPVFGAGTVTWADDRLIVRNQSYLVGDTVGFGGGAFGEGSTSVISVPDACDDSVERWSVN